MTLKRKLPRRLLEEDDLIEELFGLGETKPVLSKHEPEITIAEDFTMDLADRFCSAVSVLKNVRKTDVALINISSDGGDVFALVRMLNAMQSSGIEFLTFCSSHAYSAGAVLLSAGTKGGRFIGPMGSTMIHPMSFGVAHQGTAEVVGQAEHFKIVNEMMIDLLAKNMKITRKKLMSLMITTEGATALWLTPQQAKELHLVDEIGIPRFVTENSIEVIGK